MAVKSKEFWNPEIMTRDDPPETWTRVIGCYTPAFTVDGEQEDVIQRAEAWLASGDLAGSFCWVTARYGSFSKLDVPAFMFAFSDPDTAFAFKLRFG